MCWTQLPSHAWRIEVVDHEVVDHDNVRLEVYLGNDKRVDQLVSHDPFVLRGTPATHGGKLHRGPIIRKLVECRKEFGRGRTPR